MVAGNHELLLDPDYDSHKEDVKARERRKLNWHGINYLQDEELVLRFPGAGGGGGARAVSENLRQPRGRGSRGTGLFSAPPPPPPPPVVVL